MFNIVLTASNVEGSENNTFVYNFPNSILLKDKYISVSSITMYYSWFNIRSSYGNNTFSYSWTVGATSTTYDVVIPDGLYEVVNINNYLQWVMINNGHYLIDGSGENVYYAEFLTNINRYKVQINTFEVPLSLPTGYSQPSNFAGYPTQTFNPIITLPANFSDLFGYTAGFASNPNINSAYTPPTGNNSNNWVVKDGQTLSYLSNLVPNIQPNSSIFVGISNINNPYSQPSSIIYSIIPDVAIGELIKDRPPNYAWNKLIDGTYTQLRVQFLGLDKSPIPLADPNLSIVLVIKDKDEMIGK